MVLAILVIADFTYQQLNISLISKICTANTNTANQHYLIKRYRVKAQHNLSVMVDNTAAK